MLLMQYNQQMELAPLFAVILLLGVIGFLMNYAVGLLERRYCFWAQRVKRIGSDVTFHSNLIVETKPCSTRFGRTALALALAAGCAGITVGTAQTLKKMTLVQMHPIMGVGEEVFLYAVPKHLGFFAAEGLDVDIQNTQTGMVSAQLLQSNGRASRHHRRRRDLGGPRTGRRSSLLLPTQTQSRHLPGRAARLADPEALRSQGQDHWRAFVRRRRRIGLEAEPDRIGITPDQYTAIATGAGPSAVAALRSGKIDALVMWDAMLAAAENTGIGAARDQYSACRTERRHDAGDIKRICRRQIRRRLAATAAP